MSNEGGRKPRCTVYVDGYNWYYGIFKQRPEWKWLNLEGYFDELRRAEEVTDIKLFTALVPEASNGKRNRHQLYLTALETLPRVSVTLGNFQLRDAYCPLCGKTYQVPEEKETDTNIAISIMEDAINRSADVMAIVSNDSDLHPAIRWVKTKYPNQRIFLYRPVLEENQKHRRMDALRIQLSIPTRNLPLDTMDKYQLPDKVLLADGKRYVTRPESWSYQG